jgi:flagellar hook-associated protein FlgK
MNILDKTGLSYLWSKIKSYVDSKLGGSKTYYGTCSTAAATQAKVVECDEFVLEKGVSIKVKFTNAQTYSASSSSFVTMNVNNTGAINLTRNGSTYLQRYAWQAGEVVDFTYDGSVWIATDSPIATTTYYGTVKLSSAVNSTSASLAATPSAVYTTVKDWGTFTISASGWSSATTDGYYTQDVAVTGMLATYRPLIIPEYTSYNTKDSEKEAWGQIDEADSGAGVITFRATDPPSIDLTFVPHGI